VHQNSASHENQNRPSNADGDATGQLDVLDADDILESDDISALEAAAAGIVSFEVAPSDPSGFEIGEVEDFGEVEVEGEAEAPPPSLSTLFGMKPKAKPVQTAPVRTAPAPAPVQAAPVRTAPAPAPVQAAPVQAAPVQAVVIPAAPVTSPLPLESVVVAEAEEPEIEAAPVSKSEPAAERTLELKRVDFALAATQLEAEDRAAQQDQAGHTEVLVRSAMPAAIRTMAGGMQAPVAARRPGSISPVALDVGVARPAMQSAPAFPPPARMPSHASMTPPKRGLSGLAIGVIAASALALVGLVGIGGYVASRALTEKSDPVALANAPESAAAAGLPTEEPSGAVVAPTAVNAEGAANASPGSVGTGSAIDVSALPTAAAPAPRIATGRTSTPSAPAAAPLAAAGPAAAAPAPVTKTSGGALPPPGGGKVASAPLAAPGAPLPPPPAPVAAAPAAPAAVASTGTVRVDPNLRAVVVDGNFRRANDGVVVVSCGSHRIKAGMKEQQTVNVPCGGSVSL